MKKINLLLLLLSSIVWAECVMKVKNGDVTLKVDDKSKSYKNNSQITIRGNSKICIVNGKGVVDLVCKDKQVFSNLTSKDNDCISTNSNSGIIKAWKSFVAYFKHTPELLVMGSSTRGGKNNAIIETVELNRYQKTFIIEDETWSPIPIKLTILNSNNKKKKEYISNSKITKFEIEVKNLKNSDKLIITNKYDNELATIIVKIK